MAAAPKQYSVTAMLTKADEPAIQKLMAAHPCWTKRYAREQQARINFHARIRAAGVK